jgi:hypothetical protein
VLAAGPGRCTPGDQSTYAQQLPRTNAGTLPMYNMQVEVAAARTAYHLPYLQFNPHTRFKFANHGTNMLSTALSKQH